MNKRLVIQLQGLVQGVGFRPFVYRLAQELELKGWVNNSASGVNIEVEGAPAQLDLFLERLESEKPERSLIKSREIHWLPTQGYKDFTIRNSVTGAKTAITLPDLSTCSQCLQEVFDPDNRRYRYPFTNCTNCGPRYSIIEALPYDRPATTMKSFTMCPQCQQEYHNPLDRRFHAQPNACPLCGPQLLLWDKEGNTLAVEDAALEQATTAIKEGLILGIKGLGGFHLVVDARNTEAVARLRQRKHRPSKPLAVMYPDLASVQGDCQLEHLEIALLQSSAAPIVLLTHCAHSSIAPNVAPGNPYLGVMLPYTPLHHLLTRDLGFPIVATSGNLASEPICTNEHQVIERLGEIADLFLVHNRAIARPLDDSLVRVIKEQPMLLRRARGYAPLPISIPIEKKTPKVLALGAHFKNTIAISIQNQVYLSQHIGDLDNELSFVAFERVINTLQNLYDFIPDVIATDMHPDYLSCQYAQTLSKPLITVQHHHAHILAAMAEHQILTETVLGVAWDGTGYGLDGTIWGGEFLLVIGNSLNFQRFAFFRPFPLPGGEQSIKEPRRTALGLLYSSLGNLEPIRAYFTTTELLTLETMLKRKLNSPLTSSVGRLFDAVAVILGLPGVISFEGESAMALEFLAREVDKAPPYPISFSGNLIDWEAMIRAILVDIEAKVNKSYIAARFHHTLAEIIVKIAQQVGQRRVILSGGCFQNKYLSDCAIDKLTIAGFEPYWPSQIPPNDGGIALGQAIAALNQLSCS